MTGPLWLQLATVSAITFAIAMFAILHYNRRKEQAAEVQGVEMHVSPYIRRASLLGQAEQRFYARLFQAVGNEVLICPKVRLGEVIEVRGDALEWRAAWNRIAAKHVDFLLVTPDTYQPLLMIELEDARGDRRDELLDRAIMAAGVPILRVKARTDYDPNALRREVELRLSAVR